MAQRIFDKCKPCGSENCLIYRHCTSPERLKIDAAKTVTPYKKGGLIFVEGGYFAGIHFICSGKVKIFNTGTDGKEQIVRMAKDGDILGHRGLGKDSAIYPVSAVALEPSVITFIEKKIFFDILRQNATLSFNLMLFYADELRHAEGRIRKIAQMSVEAKVADALLFANSAFGTNKSDALNVLLSRQEIADIAGTTKEQVSKYLSEFRKKGIIATRGKAILLKKITHLQQSVFS